MARGHHVGLQQGPFQVHMMVIQSLVHSSQDLRIRGGSLRSGSLSFTALCSQSRGGCVGMTVQVSTGSHSQGCSRTKRKSAWGKCLHLNQRLWRTSFLSGCPCGMCLCPGCGLTFSVTYWQRLRSWSPSGRISGSTIGTMPFCR